MKWGMSDHPDHVGRRHPARRPVYESGNLSPIIFLTVCSHGRKPLFAAHDIHRLLCDCWRDAARWVVGRYMILPDHIHLFCSPVSGPYGEPVHMWVKYWKALASKRWPRPDEHPIWQVDAWDTQLRHGDHYGAKWEYVVGNPVRHGLCARPEDWPYQGEIHHLTWHDRT